MDNLVSEKTKEKRITIWDNLFQKYERISKESTNIINVEDTERVYLKENDTNFNCLKSRVAKKKRGRSRSRKVNSKNKRTKVLKLDDNLKGVVNDVNSASNAGLNFSNCVSEELVPEVTHINTIEELRNHQELVVNLTNHNLFKIFSESDSSGEILIEDDPPECDLIDDTNLVNVQNNINVPEADSSTLKKSYEMQNLEDNSDNVLNNSTNLAKIEDQNYHRKELVSEWLNKIEPFKKCIPLNHGDLVYFKESVVSPSVKFPAKNTLFDLEIKSNHCDCKSQDAVIDLFPKRISTRSKRPKSCATCNNHKSPKEVDINPIKQENVETPTVLSKPDLSNHNQRNISKKIKLEDLSNEASCSGKSLQDLKLKECLGEESFCKGGPVKCKQTKLCISPEKVKVCYSKKENGEKPNLNETYILKSDSDISNIETSKEEDLLNLEMKSDDLSAKHESDSKILQNLKMKFSMDEMFYKRSKRPKAHSSSKEVDISSTKQSNAEPVRNWLEKVKSDSNMTSSTKILKEGYFKNLMHESSPRIDDHGLVKNKRTLTANSLNGFEQLDESFRSSFSRMNSIISLSRASNTSTPIKEKEKSPKQNKDEEYLKIKNKIENEFKSNLGYMAYKRHKLHQNSGASNKEETEFWENSVKKEIQKLSRVIPPAVLLRYMKEYINLRINSSGMIDNASRRPQKVSPT